MSNRAKTSMLSTTRQQRRRRRRNDQGGAIPSIMQVPRTINLNTIGTPDSVKVWLRYKYLEDVSATLGAPRQRAFRGNSLYDPDATGTGNQPLFFDQWSALYSLYYVDRSVIKVTVTNKSTTQPVQVTIVPWVSSTITTNWNTLLEHSKTRAGTAVSIYNPPLNLQHSELTRTMFGVQPYDIQFRGSTTSNPSSMWYWHVGVYDPAGSGATVNYYIQVEILYHVTFSQRVQQTGS